MVDILVVVEIGSFGGVEEVHHLQLAVGNFVEGNFVEVVGMFLGHPLVG